VPHSSVIMFPNNRPNSDDSRSHDADSAKTRRIASYCYCDACEAMLQAVAEVSRTDIPRLPIHDWDYSIP